MERFLAICLLLLFSQAFADVLEGQVVSVTDGDTIKVLDADKTEYKVRLFGIDAPEKGQPFGNASKRHLTYMTAGKDVRIEYDKTDGDGRLLGKIWVRPGDCLSCAKTLNANFAQVTMGHAWWYRHYANELTPEDRGRYESAEDEARARRIGLWSEPDPIPPWDWRKSVRDAAGQSRDVD